MGVYKFGAWIQKRYPLSVKETPIYMANELTPCDNLYIDFYTLVYSGLRQIDKSKGMPTLEDPSTWEDLFKAILKSLDMVV